MIKDRHRDKPVTLAAAISSRARLPYAVELWNLPRTAPERVVGRAGGIVLARAIFAAAQKEHLGRRVVLRRGGRILDESG
jgi:hypothetical protein